ncbi:MAG: hypothetical protein JSU74_09115 [Candidatus Zixiibacteriota bacterium]|nr:MAG: hypothetical protein JSU74_09115 [candidate division Zixibacteria bacterium]
MLKIFTKLFKLGKKGAKAAKGKDKGGPVSAFDWPSGIRVGIYGHNNSGKTVYFTVLNEECKISRNLQISVTDNATSSEFLANRRSIWGLGTTSDVGTVVDLQGEQKFPDPTERDKVLLFNAILDGDRKVSVVTYDYPGKAVSITGADEIKEKVADFMAGCDGLVFFYDPKIMGSELESQAHVASFVSMLEMLAPHHKRLPIPIALVVTKADVLPGFTGEDQSVLISPDDEHLLSEDFDLFLNKILVSSKIATDPTWTGTVRNLLVRLADFLKVVVGRTLNFQIFFVSCTGQTPEKIGTDVGRSIYKPPEKIHAEGVKEPFYWLLNGILRNRKIARLRSIARTVAMVCIIWAVVYSLPFLYHFAYQLPRTEQVEQEILKANEGNVFTTSNEERRKVISAYSRYENSKLINWLFQKFQAPSGKIRQFYRDFDISEAVKALDKLIGRMDVMVADSALWPKLNPSTDSLQLSPEWEKLVADVGEYHVGDEDGVLYTRSDRVLSYWDLFSQYIAGRFDTAFAARILEQVDFNSKTYGSELSAAEEKLAATFAANLEVQAAIQEKKEIAQKASVELDDVISEINSNNDGEFRLVTAVERLQRLKSELNPATDAEGIAAIDRYLSDARNWNRPQRFTYRIETIPDNGHIHIEVTRRGEDPTWSWETQIFEGDEYTIEWKMNDDVHITFDEMKHPCNWGNSPSDKKVLKGQASIFDMEGDVRFENLGKQVSISFKPELAERLPRLRK